MPSTLLHRVCIGTLCSGAMLLSFQSFAAESNFIQLSPEAQAAADDGTFTSLQKIETILKEVSALRQLPIKRPVKVTVINREALQKELSTKIKEEIPPEKIRAEEAMYRQLGMLPADFSYGTFMLDLYTEQIGGFYDPKTRDLKLIQGMTLTGAEQDMLIAHELTHALQDQYYQLDDLMNASQRKENDDATLALMALVEGDATVTSMEYLKARYDKNPLAGFFSLVGTLTNQLKMVSSFKTFQSAPKFIQESLIFPYQQGSQFIEYFMADDFTFKEIDTLYQNIPQSTEHILHPYAYTSGDDPEPIKMKLEEFDKKMVISSSSWGELGYRQYFRAHLPWKQARTVASGWAGDTYYITKDNQFAFASRWDTQQDATEFVNAYQKTLKKRFPSMNKSMGESSVKSTATKKESLSHWVNKGRHFFLYRHNKQALLLENISGEQAVSKALQSAFNPDVFTKK